MTSRDDPRVQVLYLCMKSVGPAQGDKLAGSIIAPGSFMPSNIAAPKEKRYQLTRWPSALAFLVLAYLDPVTRADALTDSSMGAVYACMACLVFRKDVLVADRHVVDLATFRCFLSGLLEASPNADSHSILGWYNFYFQGPTESILS